MWVVAGVLLGIVVLASLVGFHAGPHSHVVAGGVGIVAALWLVIMALTGQSAPLLWALLSADLVVSAGVGVAAWKALTTTASPATMRLARRLDGEEGTAVTELSPDGVVRVRGETWSATSLNGPVAPGTRIQVVEADGVRLRVWGETEGGAVDASNDADHPEPLSS